MTASESYVEEVNQPVLRESEESWEFVLRLDLRGPGTGSVRSLLSVPSFWYQTKSALTSRSPSVTETSLATPSHGKANPHLKGKPTETGFSQPEHFDRPFACFTTKISHVHGIIWTRYKILIVGCNGRW